MPLYFYHLAAKGYYHEETPQKVELKIKQGVIRKVFLIFPDSTDNTLGVRIKIGEIIKIPENLQYIYGDGVMYEWEEWQVLPDVENQVIVEMAHLRDTARDYCYLGIVVLPLWLALQPLQVHELLNLLLIGFGIKTEKVGEE